MKDKEHALLEQNAATRKKLQERRQAVLEQIQGLSTAEAGMVLTSVMNELVLPVGRSARIVIKDLIYYE